MLAVAVALLAEWCAAHFSQAQNLTGQLNLHDPSAVLEQDGRYYLFYTGTRVRSKFSDDLIHWNEGPRVFESPPAWTSASVPGNTGNFWAPDVAHFNNLYHLYYSVSTFGSQESVIGLATNPTLDPNAPNYQWSDRGPVIESNVGDVFNAIDPSIIETSSGEIWMSYGSFWNGIYMRRIDANTGLLATPPRGQSFGPFHLAFNGAIEAPYVYERDGFFYLFVNWGTCCRGEDSTYNIRVGRSTSVSGPYVDQNGVNMVNNGGSLFLATEEEFIGPGHISIFTERGSDWFGYHYYDGASNGASRYNLRAIHWTNDGWPVAGPPFPVPEPHCLSLAVVAGSWLGVAGQWITIRNKDRCFARPLLQSARS
jgi:arabinan endo-1,5-alpha-L-arabinosidase